MAELLVGAHQATQRPGTSGAKGLRGAVLASRQTGFFASTGPDPGMVLTPVAVGRGRRSPLSTRLTGVAAVRWSAAAPSPGVATAIDISSARMKDRSATAAPKPPRTYRK